MHYVFDVREVARDIDIANMNDRCAPTLPNGRDLTSEIRQDESIALPAADAARGTFTRHPYAGGSRKPHQAKLKWRPRLTV